MKLMNTMIGIEDGTASLGLFGEISEDSMRPPHVQITVNIDTAGSSEELKSRAVAAALEALEDARAGLKAAN